MVKGVVKSVKRQLQAVGKLINAIPGLSTVVGIAIAVVASPAAAGVYFKEMAGLNVAISLANGAPLGDVIMGFAVGMVTSGIGGALGASLSNSLGVAGHYLAGGLTGGVAGKALGGRFKDGFAGGLLGAAARHVMGGFEKSRGPAKEEVSKNSESQAALEEANLKLAQEEFRRLYEKGVLPEEFKFIDNLEGGLDNKALSFKFVDVVADDRLAEMDIYNYTGATVFRGGAETFEIALDTVAHEIFHMEPNNQALWKSGGFGRTVSQRQATRIAREPLKNCFSLA
ncbi:hypothetical protein [Microbulbifer sp. TYP-18]|uniref:hypothetical protein n=1 Tax=Microbulbifer sp. TYP-18 TaxID=3230024 RepID=UPI0034C5EB99